jgi:hypothetical protein
MSSNRSNWPSAGLDSPTPADGGTPAAAAGGNWLGGVVVPLLVAVLRVAWLAPWLELLRRWVAPSSPSPILPATVLLLFFLLSLVCARLLMRQQSFRVARLAQAVIGLAVILVFLWWQYYRSQSGLWTTQWLSIMAQSFLDWESELPAPLIAIPVFIYLWLRGTLDAQPGIEREDAWGAFAGGFLALVVCAIASGLDHGGLPSGMSMAVFVFFIAGMAALALSSLVSARHSAARSGDGQISPNRYWLASVASVIVVLLAIGLLLSFLISPDVIARSMAWTSLILNAVGIIFTDILLVFAFLIFSLLSPLINLFHNQPKNNSQNGQLTIPDIQSQFKDIPKGTTQFPHAWSAILPWLGLAVVILVIGLAFALALRRLQARGGEDVDETREIILSRSLFAQQLAELRNRLRRGRSDDTPANPFLSLDEDAEPRRRIRAIYQAFLGAMREHGHARQPGQTPAEYRTSVHSVLPDADGALDTMTSTYSRARYSPATPSSRDVDQARQAWDSVRDALDSKQQSAGSQAEGVKKTPTGKSN